MSRPEVVAPEPCRTCAATDYDGLLGPWGDCPTCEENRDHDARTEPDWAWNR